MFRFAWLCLSVLILEVAVPATTSAQASVPNILLVVAHPDDEAMFAASAYKVTHTLGGNVDLALVTDGSGGFRYSQLAEPIYGLKLTDEAVAREHLPAIRKKELEAGGKIVGIRNHFYLEQYDNAYTENVDTIISQVWNADEVRGRLRDIMARFDYDFVFVHLPIPEFHAHHKAATILALEAAQALPDSLRPVVLGSFVGTRGADEDFVPADYTGLTDYPITRVRTDVPPFTFDLTEPLDPTGRLDYRIVVNWLIAEHKTQGTMQLLMNAGDIERFWLFEANDPAQLEPTAEFFKRLAVPALAVDDSVAEGVR
jgi:LmbE family N-acetylglucosaminyl deacetylase